ncbi:MAG: hypothetical protein IT445_15070 [Phycisphaeraceae bacterium]|nr:hypothetical protein [Phycisphaeraceae bacterium]
MSRSLRCLTGSIAMIYCCALTVHAETVAHWAFNEGAGQTAGNAVGSGTMNLQLGSTSDPDASDPAWVSGGVNGDVNNTYLLKSGWTAADETALALADTSYSIETVVSLDSLPGIGGSFSDKAMGLVFFRDLGDSSYKYLLRLYAGNTTDDLWVGYYNTDNGNLAAYNIHAANDGDTLTATLDRQYYVAAIYDKDAGSMQLIVRDMVTGQQASKTAAGVVTSALSASPDILFYAAAESPARSLDGTMYDLRISNSVVPEAQRLYNGSFFPGDANNDGLVNLSDLQILGDNWQSVTATWAEADFNNDGTVNLSDLQILGDNWGFGASPDISFDEALGQVSIPEPATCLILGAGSILMMLRKR